MLSLRLLDVDASAEKIGEAALPNLPPRRGLKGGGQSVKLCGSILGAVQRMPGLYVVPSLPLRYEWYPDAGAAAVIIWVRSNDDLYAL